MSSFVPSTGETKTTNPPNTKAVPVLDVDELAKLIKPPYLIAFGHSSYKGCGKDVALLGEQCVVTYTQPGNFGWSDEIALAMNYIKKHGKLPGNISTTDHNYKGVLYPAVDQKLCMSSDTTKNYTFDFHDHNGAGKAAGYGMGVWIANGTTLEPIQPLMLANENLEVTAEKEKGKITVAELLRLGRSLGISNIVGLGCKRGDVQYVVPDNKDVS